MFVREIAHQIVSTVRLQIGATGESQSIILLFSAKQT